MLASLAQLERVLARLARGLGDVAVAIGPVLVDRACGENCSGFALAPSAGRARLLRWLSTSGRENPLVLSLSKGEREMPDSLLGEERALWARHRSPRRRAEFLAGRIAARRAVAQALGEEREAELEIGRDPTGAPSVRGHPALHVSISHSHGLAAAVAAPFAVGVDLERTEPRPEAFARMFFTDAEHERLAAVPGPEREELLHVLWTRKEAASKVGRWGGRLPFGTLDCSGETVTVSGRRIALRSAFTAGYALSVAREVGGG
ncbi:MAG TPA: 4'-phosphopantetheinyl transferase superfamily protein [Anaeromyxobacter sp.]|nr:4'-phosphopantetheinyl transferase superfamily protein [Anaeromyxobacter sp.]